MAAVPAPVAPITPSRSGSLLDSKIKRTPGRIGGIVFGLALLGGVIYSATRLLSDLQHVQVSSPWPFVLLGLALAIALGFEFVNGFHDTGNTVATAIYTHTLEPHKKEIDRATKFIPSWVKVAVALALGLGTMIGWKRIVVTVGERIGKEHLTYAQGASAELVAMGTILTANRFGLPVSTTHVLTSGVAGTMAANGSGLQWNTIRSLVAAWVLTLPMSMALAGGLYWMFRRVF